MLEVGPRLGSPHGRLGGYEIEVDGSQVRAWELRFLLCYNQQQVALARTTSARVMGQSVRGLLARRCSLAGFLLANGSPRLFNRYPRAASGKSTC